MKPKAFISHCYDTTSGVLKTIHDKLAGQTPNMDLFLSTSLFASADFVEKIMEDLMCTNMQFEVEKRCRGAARMMPRTPPRGISRNRPGPDAAGILSGRSVWGRRSPGFAKSLHFGLLHGGVLDGPGKPVILFTAYPNGPPVPGIGAPLSLPDRDELPARAKVDGPTIPVRGIGRASDSPMLSVERFRLAPSGADILMYGVLRPYGLCEWGASGLFIGPSGRGNPELRLCCTVGEFWAFLAHLKLVCVKLGPDAPFTVLVSMRNASGRVLSNYGDKAFGPPWDVHRDWPSSPGGPRAGSRNIQWRHAFGTVGETTNGAIAQTARGMAKYVYAEYSGGPPRCYGAGGAFCWKLWWRTWSEALKRCRP